MSMRKRAAQELNPEMGRMGAEGRRGLSGRASPEPTFGSILKWTGPKVNPGC
jgi:hypothetical protein